jgi:hypothetical protein
MKVDDAGTTSGLMTPPPTGFISEKKATPRTDALSA